MTDTITHEVPVRDKIEDWQKIYDRLRDMSEGEIVKYAELLDLLMLPHSKDGLQRLQQLSQRARRKLQEDDHRTAETVRLVGYQIISVEDHLTLATRHQERSRKAMRRARKTLETPDLTNATNAVRNRFGRHIVATAAAEQAIAAAMRREREMAEVLNHQT